MDLSNLDTHPLIDVREPAEFAQGHLPGAQNIPLGDVSEADIQAGSNIYCRSGRRSGQAVEILKEKGIETQNIGGIMDYDGPVER